MEEVDQPLLIRQAIAPCHTTQQLKDGVLVQQLKKIKQKQKKGLLQNLL